VGRGLGSRQLAIVRTLEVNGCPMLGAALTIAVWNASSRSSAETIPYSFYE